MANGSYPRSQAEHTAGIDYVVAVHPGMQTRGFWRQVREIGETFEGGFREQAFRPDCFRIDHENKVVEIHEVVVTHEPKPNLLHMVGQLFMCFDSTLDWDLRMYVHRRGQSPSQVDLWHWYVDSARTQRGLTNDWEA